MHEVPRTICKEHLEVVVLIMNVCIAAVAGNIQLCYHSLPIMHLP